MVDIDDLSETLRNAKTKLRESFSFLNGQSETEIPVRINATKNNQIQAPNALDGKLNERIEQLHGNPHSKLESLKNEPTPLENTAFDPLDDAYVKETEY